MLIKYYTMDDSVVLLDNVTDVMVITNPKLDQYNEEPWKRLAFDYEDQEHGKPKTVISFGKDGLCALMVYGVAYICNDDGKTLEKVGF